ncbi:MAG: S-layer homology domain-containing protein [Clostridia bacterium]|nr:S-layer homology domain-containing protein [Clostridia bacterium]
MKKLSAVLLVFVMAFSVMHVFAEGIAEDVLVKVKGKIEVPRELTEFRYSENKYDDVLRYDFTWNSKDYGKELYVSTDSLGRIVTYNYYEQMDYSADRTLIDYTTEDARPLAEETIKIMFPEYGIEKLVLNEDKITSNYSGRYKTFSFNFERVNDIKVESNRVVVRIRATKDKMYVQSVNASLDEDAKFISVDAKEHFDTAGDYEEKFPIRLYYATDYSGKEPSVKLFYSIDKGYLEIATGNALQEEYFDRYAGMTEDSVSMEAGGTLMNKNEAMLTDEEKGEIGKMESLVKPEEVEKVLRSLSILKITDDMKFSESYTYKSDSKYFVNFTLQGEKRHMNVSYNGETGEVINISSYFTKYDRASDEVIDFITPEDEIKVLTKSLSGTKLDETKVEFTKNNNRAVMSAKRIVNGVAFPENNINVTYDAEEEMVTRYSISWADDTSSFPNPEDVIGLDAAREIIFKDDVSTVWLKQKEGYVGAVTIPEAVTINAIDGEELYKNINEKLAYTDVKNHWAEDIINALWEHDIYVEGGKFTPDEAITQADMIRLFSACRDSGIIPIGWDDIRISSYALEEGFVEAAEPEKLMARIEGFEALIEILGYGDVADFDIYKSSYTDMEPNGSAEILKAMGVLVGGTARPDDNLTYAEAAVMVYRYLSK